MQLGVKFKSRVPIAHLKKNQAQCVSVLIAIQKGIHNAGSREQTLLCTPNAVHAQCNAISASPQVNQMTMETVFGSMRLSDDSALVIWNTPVRRSEAVQHLGVQKPSFNATFDAMQTCCSTQHQLSLLDEACAGRLKPPMLQLPSSRRKRCTHPSQHKSSHVAVCHMP